VAKRHYKTNPRKRGHGGRFQAIPFNANTALSTLADGTVLTTVLTALVQDFFAVSADVSVSFRGRTDTEGPLQFGFANSDLSLVEIGEALDASPSSESDIIARERIRRPVRRIGRVSPALADQSWNDGNPKRVQLRFNLANSLEVNGWVRNQSGANLTTGAIIEWQGTIYGYWR